jgi:DNA-directed RNA polymerase subunit omega
MAYIPIERLIAYAERPSLYKLVLIAATRANQLSQGAQPLIKSESKKVASIALEEIAAGKIRYEEIKTKGKKSSS